MTTPPSSSANLTASGQETILPTSAPTRRIGPYRLLQRLGEGGMGEVWLAEQVEPIRRQVAVKVIKAGMDTAQVIARFEAERQALALMDHPTIAKVFDGGATPEGRPYFAMEYVRGEPITSYCDRMRLPLRQRLELFIQLCEGVQHAHQKGIIHRDLKPSNVLVSTTDDRPVPRIIDFGIAKAMAQPLTERSLVTEMGALIGTPEYMSPEQAEMGTLDVDTRSDVYSLGVLLYELLAGALPFESSMLRTPGIDDVRRTIREIDPPRPSTRLQSHADAAAIASKRRAAPQKLLTALRGDLDWITLKALEKDRTRRYATANGLALDVRRHLENEPVSAGPPTARYRIAKFVRRHRYGVFAATAAVMLIIVTAAVVVVQAQRVASERDRANHEAATAKQVSDFLVSLFTVSDPSQARGRDITAREILSEGSRRLQHDLRDQPDVQARLQATIGDVYATMGLYRDAETLLQQALDTMARRQGDAHPATLEVVESLGTVYWSQLKMREAVTLFETLVRQRGTTLGPNDRETLNSKTSLALMYLEDKERLKQAETLMRDTLEAQRSLFGEHDTDTVATMNNLQVLLFRQQRFGEALPLARRVLEMRTQLLGADHPNTLRAMQNVATNYSSVGNVSEAESLFKATLEARTRVLGATHPDTARTRHGYGAMLRRQRRYSEAEPLLLAAHAALHAALGPQHTLVLTATQSLADLYEETGNAAELAKWKGHK